MHTFIWFGAALRRLFQIFVLIFWECFEFFGGIGLFQSS